MNIATKPIAAPSLVMKRHFNAPVPRVFAAWASADAMKRWFGPSENLPCTLAEIEFRVGGAYKLVLEGGGERHCVIGTYREIVAERRLVFSWAWESTPERESLVTVEFAPAEGGTMLTLTHVKFADEEARARHEHGWAGTLDRLAKALG